VRRVLAEKVPLAFDMSLESAPSEGRYGVRVFPQEKGISVFFQRREAVQVDDDSQTTGGIQ
jgi:hypothetical protein